MIQHFVFKKDNVNRKILVERGFNAPLAEVWAAWTESDLLDQWWAPKPWKAETKTMDFRPGGLWIYAMVSPDGLRMFSRVDFEAINSQKSFSYFCAFCDENGVKSADFSMITWNIAFVELAAGTQVNVAIDFEKQADFEKMMAMGFEGGFTMGLANLDELLAK
jgi:uncharacterized protein YndB with AHSA1/START domain